MTRKTLACVAGYMWNFAHSHSTSTSFMLDKHSQETLLESEIDQCFINI